MKTLLYICIVIYLLVSAALYFLQDRFIFDPHPLPDDFSFQVGTEVNLPVSENVQLNCLWVKKKKSKGVLLYFHGNRGNISRALYQANRLGVSDYDLFIPDYRSYGKSDGKLINDKQLLEDAAKVYMFVKKKYPENKIHILGYSLGSGMASQVAKLNNPAQLILVAPFTSLTAIKNKYLWMFPNFLLKFKLSNEKHLEEVSCPITLIHGTADKIISYDFSTQLKKKFPQIRLISKEGVSHRGLIFQLKKDMHQLME